MTLFMSREQEIRDAIERFLSRARQTIDKELEALATDLIQIVRGDMRTSRTDVERAAIEVARAVAKGGTHARHDLMTGVALTVRRLDDATSIRGILDVLGDGAAVGAARLAVLLVEADTVKSYRHHGFPAGETPADLPLEASPLLAGAVKLRQLTKVHPAGDRPDPRRPAFLRVEAGNLGLILPVVVGQQVVALVFGEGPDRQQDEPGAPVWTEQLEVLVRHASSRLESITSLRTVEVLSGPS